ncbi:MAG: hypothetical protein PUI70_05010 [Bacteroidales bacterium]|nr:hypothetical protein [Bacteroidales bacterium]
MNYDNFTTNQKVLTHSIFNKIENSGCSTDEVVDVLSEVFGYLLAYVAPSRELLTDCMDTKVLPGLRRRSVEYYELKQVKFG